MKIRLLLFFFIGLVLCLIFSSCATDQPVLRPPGWWFNPRHDDQEFVFVKANSDAQPTEQMARDKAYANALSLLSRRIGSNVSVNGSSVNINSNYALRDTRIYSEYTARSGNNWYSWVLVAYPQKEKKALLARLEKAAENIRDIQSRVKSLPENFRLEINTTGGRKDFRDGEKVSFTVKSSKPCYLAVFCHQSDGSTVLLYPNSWSGMPFVPAGKTVDIPGSDNPDFEIIVGPPYGTDIIQAIACTEYSSFHKKLKQMAGEQTGYSAVPRGLFSRAINQSVANSAKNATPPLWGEAEISVSTYPKK